MIVSRISQVAFVPLRVGFCNLNYGMYIKSFVEAETFECCHREDCKHDLLQCTNYTSQRNVILEQFNTIIKTNYISPQNILNGYKKLVLMKILISFKLSQSTSLMPKD